MSGVASRKRRTTWIITVGTGALTVSGRPGIMGTVVRSGLLTISTPTDTTDRGMGYRESHQLRRHSHFRKSNEDETRQQDRRSTGALPHKAKLCQHAGTHRSSG